MRLDLQSVAPAIQAEVEWIVKDNEHGHTYKGVIRFADTPDRYTIRLVRGRFGATVSIYPLRTFMVEELDASRAQPVPLPETLSKFDGGIFTLDGAEGGQLQKQIYAIEMLDELPKGYKGIGHRWVLKRELSANETRAVIGKLGYDLSNHDFDEWVG